MNRDAHHVHGQEGSLSWRCQFSPDWPIDSMQSQTKFPMTLLIGKQTQFGVVSPVCSWLDAHGRKGPRQAPTDQRWDHMDINNNNDK